MKSPTSFSDAIFFVTSSAGELEWIAPIISLYAKHEIRTKILLVFDRAKESVNRNQLAGSMFRELPHSAGLLFSGKRQAAYENVDKGYRALRRLGLLKPDGALERVFLAIARRFFFRREELTASAERLAVFMEFPSDKKLFYRLVRAMFPNAVVFFFPHSPHPYHSFQTKSAELDACPVIDSGDTVYLFGDERDPSALMAASNWTPLPKSKIVIVGHPKYSSAWIESVKKKLSLKLIPRTKDGIDPNKIVVGVLSRGFGSHINSEEQKRLVETLLEALDEKYPDSKAIVVKKHPREFRNTAWDLIHREDLRFSDEHIWSIFFYSDLIVTFWSSAAIDASVFGREVIEFYDPQRFSDGQLCIKGEWKTVYGAAGFARTCRNYNDLIDVMPEYQTLMQAEKYSTPLGVEARNIIDKADLGLQTMSDMIRTAAL